MQEASDPSHLLGNQPQFKLPWLNVMQPGSKSDRIGIYNVIE